MALLISSANGRMRSSERAIKSDGTSSSSEKSIPVSTKAVASINRSRQLSARSPSRPLSCRNACRRCASVSAATRSARPSTAVKSMRPFSNARRVNSPASAWRKPASSPNAEAPQRSPPGRHEPATRRCLRQSRCSGRGTKAPSLRRSGPRSLDGADAPTRPVAPPAHARSTFRALSLRAGPRCG